ncbi:hypothetical protein FB107DRAFT_208836 [Schizophyllum commune]
MPPRRTPPPPPQRGSTSTSAHKEYPSGRHPLGISPPPPPPRRTYGLPPVTSSWPRPTRRLTVDEIEQDDPELGRLLRRPPPPPPSSKADTQGPPPLPANRPSRSSLPTPPPEPDTELETQYEPHYPEQSTDAQSVERPTCLKCHDFSIVDAHAAQFPRQSVQSLEQLAYDLTSPFPTETDRFRAIFTWMHHNIDYDTQAFFGRTVRAVTPEETLRSGLAVCGGYAGLLVHLAELSGVTAYEVSGHGKGFGFEALPPGAAVPEERTGHAWNCCYMDGVWQLVDPCWGAGALVGGAYERRFAPEWFSMTPIEFVQRHFPTDRSFQLIGEEDGGVVEWADYIMAAPRPQLYSDFHEQKLHPDTIQPISREVQGGATTVFSVWKWCEHMSTAEEDNYIYAVKTSDKLVPMERNDQGGWSASVYVPRGGNKVSLYAVGTITERSLLGADKEVSGLGYPVSAFKKAIGKKAMSFKVLVAWNVV